MIALIPARYNSKRFPGKPLTMINGKTMIQRVYEAVSSVLFTVILTDDKRIFDVVSEFGKAILTEDARNGTERCAAFCGYLSADIVINVQCDNPYIKPEHIKTLISLFDDKDVTIASLVTELKEDEKYNPDRVKAVLNSKGYAINYSREYMSNSYKAVGVYGYRLNTLLDIAALPVTERETLSGLEQLRWMDYGYRIKCGFISESISIDRPEDKNDFIKSIISQEAKAVSNIPIDNYDKAIDLIYQHVHKMGGKVITTGMGKAGQIANTIATTFCSTGTPAVFLHPGEAQHGDLGVIQKNDILLAVSNSGETREVIELIALVKRLYPLPVIAISKGMICDVLLKTGNPDEVCSLGTPTTSTTVMSVIGDILVSLMMDRIGFSKEEYLKRHHAGYIGRNT
jgi:arabinose-5-phosphate isomerase